MNHDRRVARTARLSRWSAPAPKASQTPTRSSIRAVAADGFRTGASVHPYGGKQDAAQLWSRDGTTFARAGRARGP